MTRAQALAWAEEARTTRERLVDDLSSGRVVLARVLERAASEPLVARLHAVTVLESLPGWGKVTCRRALASAGIDEQAPLGGLDAAAVLEVFGASP
ncbi:MAG TPA: integration host factor, actinobacterial type [Microthrixaceae bacterium]|nr:integration host factor, actinobacterial type [Microthrixaceae bacterium]